MYGCTGAWMHCRKDTRTRGSTSTDAWTGRHMLCVDTGVLQDTAMGMHGHTDTRMYGHVDAGTDGHVDTRTHGCMDIEVQGQTDARMH